MLSDHILRNFIVHTNDADIPMVWQHIIWVLTLYSLICNFNVTVACSIHFKLFSCYANKTSLAYYPLISVWSLAIECSPVLFFDFIVHTNWCMFYGLTTYYMVYYKIDDMWFQFQSYVFLDLWIMFFVCIRSWFKVSYFI